MFKPIARLLMLACCSALAVSCAPSKASQCQDAIALAGAANSRATALAAPSTSAGATQGPVNDPDDLLQAAKALATAGDELLALRIVDPQLQGWRTEYAATYSELATATRELVVAIEKRDREAAEGARDRLNAASATEADLVQTINDYCLSDEP